MPTTKQSPSFKPGETCIPRDTLLERAEGLNTWADRDDGERILEFQAGIPSRLEPFVLVCAGWCLNDDHRCLAVLSYNGRWERYMWPKENRFFSNTRLLGRGPIITPA